MDYVSKSTANALKIKENPGNIDWEGNNEIHMKFSISLTDENAISRENFTLEKKISTYFLLSYEII